MTRTVENPGGNREESNPTNKEVLTKKDKEQIMENMILPSQRILKENGQKNAQRMTLLVTMRMKRKSHVIKLFFPEDRG